MLLCSVIYPNIANHFSGLPHYIFFRISIPPWFTQNKCPFFKNLYCDLPDYYWFTRLYFFRICHPSWFTKNKFPLKKTVLWFTRLWLIYPIIFFRMSKPLDLPKMSYLFFKKPVLWFTRLSLTYPIIFF